MFDARKEKNLTSIQPFASQTRLIKINSRKHLSMRSSQSRKFFERVSVAVEKGQVRKGNGAKGREKYRRSWRVHCREPGIFETGVRVTRLVDGSASFAREIESKRVGKVDGSARG